jgi:diaminopimelate epimerase
MNVHFYKYQGTGNDFILIDNREKTLPILPMETIARWCDRKFGIGADGLMLLQNKEGFDFEMIYYNADGNISSMCGNGGRCITAFAAHLGLLKEKAAYFLAIDGPHHALIEKESYVSLQMIPVDQWDQSPQCTILNTGSPHYIQFVDQVNSIDVVTQGRAIRQSPPFKKEGINVNFVAVTAPNQIDIATYERGVENETLSCGTGVTAAAIAYHAEYTPTAVSSQITIQTKGGALAVKFQFDNNIYDNIWLSGAATLVFEGSITL